MVVRNLINLYLQMRRPDMMHLLSQNFRTITKNDFFTIQETIAGKNMCDLCITDHNMIRQALNSDQATKEKSLQGTICGDIIQNNYKRYQILKDMRIIPSKKVLHVDFNYQTLIERSIKINAFKSLKHILEFIKKCKNSNEYFYDLMLEFKNI